jgi:hypothetical protein
MTLEEAPTVIAQKRRESAFTASALLVQMRYLLVAFIIVAAINASADDLEDLKAASVSYVVAMRAALQLPDGSDCSELIAKVNEYAAVKLDYYRAARQAMPALIQVAKGPQTNSRYGDELIEIFRGFGEDRDEEATAALEAKLKLCPNSDQRDQARMVVEQANETAERFVKDFGRLDGA